MALLLASACGRAAEPLPEPLVAVPPARTVDGLRQTSPTDDRTRDSTIGRRPFSAQERPALTSLFQRFVEDATGKRLPIFGEHMFGRARGTVESLGDLPVPAQYRLRAGDEVVVRAWGSIDVNRRAVIDRDGKLHLPRVGSFAVAGVAASELERHLRSQLGRIYRDFRLNASVTATAPVKVFVTGPARWPGSHVLPGTATAWDAVVAAGGPAANGSMRHVVVRRGTTLVAELDLYDFAAHRQSVVDTSLQNGDVVAFMPAGAHVALTGALDGQAIYELRSPEETLQSLLRYSGGVPVLADPQKVQLERVDPANAEAARSVEQFRLDRAGLSKPLRDGDVLTLLEIGPRFSNAVTLMGHVAQPLRHAWIPGMRIRDLIPDREALISPDFYRRKNSLVQMLDEGSPLDGNIDPSQRKYPDGERTAGNGRAREDVSRRDETARGSGRGEEDDSPEGDSAAATPSSVTAPPAPGAMASVAARTEASMRRRDEPPSPLFDDLNWHYASIERLDRSDLSNRVLAFDLAAALRGDAEANLELLPGDVVTIYGKDDIRMPIGLQTRLATLEGEVVAPGVYQLQPGETLQQLIVRAGGFTSAAYVYGIEFTREEVRRRQRENLAAAIARIEASGTTQSARDLANRRDDPTFAAGGASAPSIATGAQVQRLRKLQPSGRIALDIDPRQASLRDLPDVPLEHRDRIVVPARPDFVTIAGAVNSGNALAWQPGRTVADYLRIAGVEDVAEIESSFILRADGTVTSAAAQRSRLGFKDVLSQPLQPGDALIVPNRADLETWGHALVRGLTDVSRVFATFGLQAAAIIALRSP